MADKSEKTETTVPTSYFEHPLAQSFKNDMLEEGVDPKLIDQVLRQATRRDSILEAISRPAEKTKEWFEYRKIFLDKNRIDNGVRFLTKHKKIFDAVESQYGVPREIIAAIIGVETRYGKVVGSYRVIDALATLAFDYPKRSPFFRSELGHFLHIMASQNIDPASLKGSYAGAMGFGQFMPSSYRSYAVDFDSDSKVDIWKNKNDAIASVANYLAKHGWLKNEKVATQVEWLINEDKSIQAAMQDERFNQLKLPSVKASELEDLNLSIELSKSNVKRKFPSIVDAVSDTELFQPYFLVQKDNVEAWLASSNFYVITRYNHSHLYAMAVFQLSQEILSGYDSQ